jgi:cytoskeletal protein CcmA (bactofilin family)
MSSVKRLSKSLIKMKDVTIVSDGCRIEGYIETSGTLAIYGSMVGTIKCNSLEMFRDSKVYATVEATNVIVAGFFEGEIVCTGRLMIAATGKIIGRASYGSLVIESGGLFEGHISKSELTETDLLPLFQRGEIVSKKGALAEAE